MATGDQIFAIRRLISEPDDTNGYDNFLLSDIIDASESLNEAAATVWREKAASAAILVDTAEGSSRRSLGDISKNALLMAATFSVPAPDSAQVGRVVSRPIVRP